MTAKRTGTRVRGSGRSMLITFGGNDGRELARRIQGGEHIGDVIGVELLGDTPVGVTLLPEGGDPVFKNGGAISVRQLGGKVLAQVRNESGRQREKSAHADPAPKSGLEDKPAPPIGGLKDKESRRGGLEDKPKERKHWDDETTDAPGGEDEKSA